MSNFIALANAQLLMNEEKNAIKTYKEHASKNVIKTSEKLVTYEQLKFMTITECNKRGVGINITKALGSRAGIYNIFQQVGLGMRTHIGFVPSAHAIMSNYIVVGHYEHSTSATFKFRSDVAKKLVTCLIDYAGKHPEAALTSATMNTRLLKA